MNKEGQEKLEILIHHWIEHNREHAAEFQKWAKKAQELDLAAVAQAISKAAETMKKSDSHLSSALKLLHGHKGPSKS